MEGEDWVFAFWSGRLVVFIGRMFWKIMKWLWLGVWDFGLRICMTMQRWNEAGRGQGGKRPRRINKGGPSGWGSFHARLPGYTWKRKV